MFVNIKDSRTLDTLEVVDPKLGRSTLLSTRLPRPLAGLCAVQLNSSHTLVVGGAGAGLAGLAGQTALSNQTWLYSSAGGFQPAGELSQARTGHSCVALGSGPNQAR